MPLYRASATCSPGQLLKEKKMLWGEDKNLLHNAFWVIWSYSQIQTSCTDPGGVWSRLKPREGKGWTRSRLRLDSNLHASTFHPISAAPSPPLTDTRTQVQLLPKQRFPATDETRWGRQIMTTSVSCPFPSSETQERRRRREKSRFGAEQEANSRGVRMDAARPVCRRSAENTTDWQCLSRLCLCVFVPPSARHCLAKAVVEGSIPLLKC